MHNAPGFAEGGPKGGGQYQPPPLSKRTKEEFEKYREEGGFISIKLSTRGRETRQRKKALERKKEVSEDSLGSPGTETRG